MANAPSTTRRRVQRIQVVHDFRYRSSPSDCPTTQLQPMLQKKKHNHMAVRQTRQRFIAFNQAMQVPSGKCSF